MVYAESWGSDGLIQARPWNSPDRNTCVTCRTEAGRIPISARLPHSSIHARSGTDGRPCQAGSLHSHALNWAWLGSLRNFPNSLQPLPLPPSITAVVVFVCQARQEYSLCLHICAPDLNWPDLSTCWYEGDS